MTTKFRELLNKAIAFEAKMAEFYGTMAIKATNPDGREILEILAGEEKQHQILLQNYLNEGIFPRVPQVSEADLAPALQLVTYITPDMKPGGALAFAIRLEEYQHWFYKLLALKYPPGLTQKFLERMADMELVHKERVVKLHRWFSRK